MSRTKVNVGAQVCQEESYLREAMNDVKMYPLCSLAFKFDDELAVDYAPVHKESCHVKSESELEY